MVLKIIKFFNNFQYHRDYSKDSKKDFTEIEQIQRIQHGINQNNHSCANSY